MINGPLFMIYGLQPRVGTSTCAFMILFTAISSVSQYFFAGHLGWQFFLWCLCFGFAAGVIGQFGVDAVLRKFQRPSYLVLLLGAIVVGAVIAMTITGSIKIAMESAEGQDIFNFDFEAFTCRR